MEDKTAESFTEHVMLAATQVHEQLPHEFPKFADNAEELARVIMSVFETPDFMHGFQRWMMIGSMVHEGTHCNCGDESKHEFLRRCDSILSGHTMTWQLEMFDSLLSSLPGLDRTTIELVVGAMANKMSATLTQVDEVEVPDYVPADWANNDD